MLPRAKLSTYKIKKIIEYFCLDLTVTQTAKLLDINRKTINRYFGIFRDVIYQHQTKQKQKLIGEVEVDEAYFVPKRIKGKATKRGRGTHKQPVFGVYERDGRVYTEIIPNCNRRTLRAAIRGKVGPENVIYSDSWGGYDGLVDVGFKKRLRINHRKDEFSDRKGVHTNGIESSWSFAKRRLIKLNGVEESFHLHLKECEWRWSRNELELQEELIEIIKNYDR